METEECIALLEGDHPFPEQRQIACGMMMQLDDGVGRVSDIGNEDWVYTCCVHASIWLHWFCCFLSNNLSIWFVIVG